MVFRSSFVDWSINCSTTPLKNWNLAILLSSVQHDPLRDNHTQLPPVLRPSLVPPSQSSSDLTHCYFASVVQLLAQRPCWTGAISQSERTTNRCSSTKVACLDHTQSLFLLLHHTLYEQPRHMPEPHPRLSQMSPTIFGSFWKKKT